MVKPPWGGGALQSLFRQTLPREEGEVEGQEGLLRLCLGAGQQHTLLLLVCSTSIPWPPVVSLCPREELSPFFLRTYILSSLLPTHQQSLAALSLGQKQLI